MKKWSGVFPATTTQFTRDERLDLPATQKVVAALIADGVNGIICLGTVGENCSLNADEKRAVMAAIREVAAGRVPVLSGVAENTTALAAAYARDAEKIGIDGLMLLPAMVYNNPVSYGVDITVDMFGELADLSNLVAIKESSEDTRRLTDLRRAHGDRYTLFGGVDDIVLECLMLGASGWVSGLTNAFPRESVALFALAREGRYTEALAIYRWFMPLLHLDTIPTLVQCIKLAEHLMGRGSEMVRAPRLMLAGEERAWVERLVRDALATRPALP